jgi:hypothetical protein
MLGLARSYASDVASSAIASIAVAVTDYRVMKSITDSSLSGSSSR